jgi:hypothetical protein
MRRSFIIFTWHKNYQCDQGKGNGMDRAYIKHEIGEKDMILTGKPEQKTPLGRPGPIRQDNIKMCLKTNRIRDCGLLMF